MLSAASPLIKDMLTICPRQRADVEKICSHWWVNEGYEQNCLDIAEELAAETPVRLDLLLSLVPQSASADKLVVGDQQATGDATSNMSSDTLVPTRCHSVGSLMELDQNNSDRRIREMVEEEPRASTAGDAKRKLETTPSMDETAAAGVKRKERSRRKERSDDREPRQYRSGSRYGLMKRSLLFDSYFYIVSDIIQLRYRTRSERRRWKSIHQWWWLFLLVKLLILIN